MRMGLPMARSRWLLILLLPLLFGFDTRNPFRTRGPFKTASTTIGSGGPGVEARYSSITAEANFVVGCSEPMDGPNGEFYNWNGFSGNYESSLSPDASECWGRTSPGDSADWQPAAYQDPPSPAQGQTIVPVTGWGSVGYAAEQTAGRGDWWLAYKPSQIAGDFGVTAATICFRYYKQVSSDYAITSDSCSGTTRNKFAELNAGNNPFQLEEDPTPSGGCHTVSESSFTRGIMACWDSGPGTDPGGCPWLSPTVKMSQAISHPMRIEQCYETTNLATGANAVVKSYVTPYPYTTTSSYTSPTATVGAPTKDFTWAANLDHTGGGTSWSGYFMFATWNNVGSHTIGAACEIEGGC